MFASTMRAVGVVLILSAAGCICPPGKSCQPNNGTSSTDPGEPGGIRTNVVMVERNGTTIGYMSQDPDPSRAHWNWWLLGDAATFPLDLAPTDTLRLVPIDPPRGRMTGAQLCTEFGATLSAPKYYKEVSQVSPPTTCE